MCQLKKIRSKPNLHVHDFSRWPPFDIGNIFINFVQHGFGMSTVTLFNKVSCQKLIYYNCYDCLKYFIEIQRLPFLKWLLFPQKFNFQIRSITENVLHDLCYNYAKFHAFTTL